MITIRLLGGAKKAVGGKASLELDTSTASVLEILRFLRNLAVEPRLLRRENLIIAINGADSSVLPGDDPVAKSGDVVTVVTVVHGGYIRKAQSAIIVKGVAPMSSKMEPGQVIDEIREAHIGLSIQIVAADAVFGFEHAHRIAEMALEAQSRKIMLAKRVEADLLLRLACTDQISEAIARAGMKKGKPACVVALSGERGNHGFEKWLEKEFEVDDSVLEQTMKKKNRLSKMLGVSASCDNECLLDSLVERAAILVS
ncbi:MAG TPA: KEOPS complex subunit Cgi121 [Nitrososphaera sp.]|jgi:tRNA threonylcarbamoyladenosine modification (KEOPS) complex Cgi121 subunit/molybdopterin converting factor small subunit